MTLNRNIIEFAQDNAFEKDYIYHLYLFQCAHMTSSVLDTVWDFTGDELFDDRGFGFLHYWATCHINVIISVFGYGIWSWKLPQNKPKIITRKSSVHRNQGYVALGWSISLVIYIFIYIFFYENHCILIPSSLKLVPWGPIDNKPELVQVMTWREQAASHYLNKCRSKYRKTSNISRVLVGNKIVDHPDVVGASPVGAAPTTSSFYA